MLKMKTTKEDAVDFRKNRSKANTIFILGEDVGRLRHVDWTEDTDAVCRRGQRSSHSLM